jgi:hypothetical protein
MGYYWFDVCPEEKVSEIGDLCKNLLGMKECNCEHPVRQWIGGKTKISMVRYYPMVNIPPLLVQSWPSGDYKTPEVRDFLSRILVITGANQVYQNYLKKVIIEKDYLR